LEVKDNGYVIKEGEKEKYNLIFQMYADGFGPAAIRDVLKERNMLINDSEPTIAHLNKIIKDERLIGKFNSTGRKKLSGLVIYPVVVDLSLFHIVDQLRKQGILLVKFIARQIIYLLDYVYAWNVGDMFRLTVLSLMVNLIFVVVAVSLRLIDVRNVDSNTSFLKMHYCNTSGILIFHH
jgi:hypothetical protein